MLFEHNDNRYRARRYTKGGSTEREFTIMRVDNGHHFTLPNPDAFINTVIPKGMAGHFLFDGEHAEVFLGEDNRGSIRKAVQDILGCSLIKTAISDLTETATYYRKQMPTSKASASMDGISSRIDSLTSQIATAIGARDGLLGDIERIEQQIADIDDKLRNSAAARQLQTRRDKATTELSRARQRAAAGQEELLRWLGDNGRYLVSTRITDLTMDHLNQQDVTGKLPSPDNEEVVADRLVSVHFSNQDEVLARLENVSTATCDLSKVGVAVVDPEDVWTNPLAEGRIDLGVVVGRRIFHSHAGNGGDALFRLRLCGSGRCNRLVLCGQQTGRENGRHHERAQILHKRILLQISMVSFLKPT